MPNQRAAGQKQVIVTMKEDFLSLVDGNLEHMGFGDRAQFIRTAVYEKMRNSGIEVEKILTTPPSRAGKGGRTAKAPPQETAMLNDEKPDAPRPPVKPTTYPKGPARKKGKQG